MMEIMWMLVESMWKIMLILVIVGGATAAHFGGIVLQRFFPHFQGRERDGPRHPDRREVAALREELEASHGEVDRLRMLEHQVGRIQEQVRFLENLLEGGQRGFRGQSRALEAVPTGDGDFHGEAGWGSELESKRSGWSSR